MGKLGVVSLALVLAAVCVPQAAANSGGAPSLSSGGAFPGERTCTQCHVGSEANSGPGTLTLTVGGVSASGDSGAAGLTYTPGETIALIVSFRDSTKFRVGFQLTARSGDGCGQPGSLAAASSADGSGIKTGSASCGPAASEVQWVTHQAPRNGSSATFAIDWTAPAEDSGPVTIAVAVNGADGSRDRRNDNIYTLQAVLQPSAAGPATPPVISDGGVTSLGDSDPALTTGAPGGIAVIDGSGFAEAGAESIGSVDADGKLATNLSGICVEVNQVRAPVLYADATTVFVQIPSETALGPAAVQVIRNCKPATDSTQQVPSDGAPSAELLSNVAMFDIASVKPVLVQLSEGTPGAVAVHDDFSLVASEPATSPAAEMPSTEMPAPAQSDAPEETAGPGMSPAVPGDVVTLFGTGFGPTDPALASGEIPALSHVLAAQSVQLMLGETTVPDDHIVYAGASPGVAGLYQVSARVPDAMPAGEFSVSLAVDMQSSPLGPMITIGVPDPSDGLTCAADLVLKVGEICSGKVDVFGTEYAGTFEVKETEACVTVQGFPPFCGAENLNPLGLGLLIAEKQEDNTWKITKFGD